LSAVSAPLMIDGQQVAPFQFLEAADHRSEGDASPFSQD
jgi:hypothetical protein